jgi:thiosulfate/3-mercaptopyruvate sulfurtransferase
MTDYPTDVLVSANWVRERLDAFESDDPSLRLLEVDIDPNNYEEEHIPGATKFDWKADLQDSTTFDVPAAVDFEELLGERAVTESSTVVIYGDMMNWFAGYAYWLLSYYGHDDVRLLDGGRDVWFEQDNPTTSDVPEFTSQSYSGATPNGAIRADRTEVEDAMDRGVPLVDVRTPEEYRGEVLAPPGWNEGVQRGGHIPGAVNIPWSQVVDAEGRFKSEEILRDLYADAGIEDEEVIVYCRIGERSALTWFVLHKLLGYADVRNYYGSWVEWGNTVGAPIEKGRRAGIRHEE